MCKAQHHNKKSYFDIFFSFVIGYHWKQMWGFVSMFSVRPEVWLAGCSDKYLSEFALSLLFYINLCNFFRWWFSAKYFVFLPISWKYMKILKYLIFFLFWRIDLEKFISAAGHEPPSLFFSFVFLLDCWTSLLQRCHVLSGIGSFSKTQSQVPQDHLVTHRYTQCCRFRAVLHTSNPSLTLQKKHSRDMLELSMK